LFSGESPITDEQAQYGSISGCSGGDITGSLPDSARYRQQLINGRQLLK